MFRGRLAAGWSETDPRDAPVAAEAPVGGLSGRDLLPGVAFDLALGSEGGRPGIAGWGRMKVGDFDGEAPTEEGGARIDGRVTTGVLGVDAEWSRLLAGVAVSMSEGEGSFAQPGVDSGAIGSTMTTVSPYARLALAERTSAWGLLGLGSGEMTIVQAANDWGQPRRRTRTDLRMRLAALGGRGALLDAGETGGVDLGLRADAFFVETVAKAVSNEGGTTAATSRVRLALEGSRSFETGDGVVMTPGLEFGLRHDAGDAETGIGVELGGRISLSDPTTGLGVEARVRAMVAHEDSAYQEWEASGSVRLDPGSRGQGLWFRLAPTWGAASSGVDRLWSIHDARGLAPDAGFEPERRLEGEIGYGVALFDDRFSGTPNLGFRLSDRARAYRAGWRITSGTRGGPTFEASLDATRWEAVQVNGVGAGAVPEVDHGVVLRSVVR